MEGLSSLNITTADIAHPHFPVDTLLPDYVANNISVLALLSIFGAAVIAVVCLTVGMAASAGRTLSRGDKAAASWFAVCGFIHLILEGIIPQ